MPIPVTCAIILKDNKVLSTQRSERMYLPLHWEFPGGKIEPNESAEDCVVREVYEELGIHIKIRIPLTPVNHKYEMFSIQLIPFLADYISGEIGLVEHRSYCWIGKEELRKLTWAPADIPILEEFLSL